MSKHWSSPGPGVGDEESRTGREELDNLQDLLDLLDVAQDRAGWLRDTDDPSTAPTHEVTGSGGNAAENRAIRHARVAMARQETRALVVELSAARERVEDAMARARRSIATSRDLRSTRTGERRSRAQRELGKPTEAGKPDPVERVGAGLAEVLDRAARRMVIERHNDRSETIERTLAAIVSGALVSIPHVQHAGISLVEWDGTIRSYAPSDAVVAELDDLQNVLDQGPCRDAVSDRHRILTDDLTSGDSRWPLFAAAARERGIGTVMSFQLFAAADGTAGALNLYADQPGAFDDTSMDTGSLFASHAALVLDGAQRAAGLNAALRTRDMIGQAKGILMERFSLTEAQAFRLLVETSQETNLKLRDVAEWTVTETGRQSDRSG